MEIILLENLPNLGLKNSILRVQSGYARNYLIPQGLAIVANKANKKQIGEHLKHIAHREAKKKKQAEHLAQKLQSLNIVMEAAAAANNKFFGAITANKIQAQLKELGVDIATEQIKILEAIKKTGKHTITIKLHEEVEISVELTVKSTTA